MELLGCFGLLRRFPLHWSGLNSWLCRGCMTRRLALPHWTPLLGFRAGQNNQKQTRDYSQPDYKTELRCPALFRHSILHLVSHGVGKLFASRLAPTIISIVYGGGGAALSGVPCLIGVGGAPPPKRAAWSTGGGETVLVSIVF